MCNAWSSPQPSAASDSKSGWSAEHARLQNRLWRQARRPDAPSTCPTIPIDCAMHLLHVPAFENELGSATPPSGHLAGSVACGTFRTEQISNEADPFLASDEAVIHDGLLESTATVRRSY